MSGIDPGIFKACDLRGTAGENVTPDVFERLGRAIGSEIGGARAVVGGDVRPSTPTLQAALMQGLVRAGCDVTDVGILPTPVLYHAYRTGKYEAALMVTASHNPPTYNGLKFMIGSEPTTPETMDRVKARLLAEDFVSGVGALRRLDVLPDYVRWITGEFSPTRFEGLRVLVDFGNGCQALVAGQVLRALGFEVVELNAVADGTFPDRNPNPSVFANLAGTVETVRNAEVDFAVAFDGDGDRAIFLDESGRPIETDRTAIFYVRHLPAGASAEAVVYDIKCSDWVRKEIVRCGGRPVIERSGHSFIRKRMMAEDAVFGAEVSGHYFFRELNYGDDGLYATLRMAACIAAGTAPLSKQMQSVPVPVITHDVRVELPEARRAAVLEAFRESFPDLPHLEVDGIRIDWPRGWALCRMSVTEPVLTLRFEGETPEALRQTVERVREAIPELRDELAGVEA